MNLGPNEKVIIREHSKFMGMSTKTHRMFFYKTLISKTGKRQVLFKNGNRYTQRFAIQWLLTNEC